MATEKRLEQCRRATLKRQSILRANGRCASCGRDSEKFVYCFNCRKRRNELDKIRRDKCPPNQK